MKGEEPNPSRIPLLQAVPELRSDVSKPNPSRIPLLRAVLELRSDVSKPDHTPDRMIYNEKGALPCLFRMGMLLEGGASRSIQYIALAMQYS